ncbi:MAG: peptide-methionine (S)-S-oxide reductase [Parcubacteria group bacterium Gr01-1014_72]|nr:MAG: peptide-methionine (S)-S-oxide reductase [Parcubacteria group bacterium Gr01-1014_72]
MEKTDTAVFGGGCFWCTEAVFKMLRGVLSVAPGYAGGTSEHPTYEAVSSGRTGHAEVIRITFDPSQITFRNLLTVFFATHNPTTKDRQGADVGTQYRSAVFYTTDKQRTETEALIKELSVSAKGGKPIVTKVVPLEKFFPAEEYHRDYYARNPQNQYCELIIDPKLEQVQKDFADLLAANEGQ